MRAPAVRLVLAGVVLTLFPVPFSSASASASTPAGTTRTAAPAQNVVGPGHATVAVAVATLWHSPSSPRAVDAPALLKPVRIRAWLAGMTLEQRRALSGRADSQLVLGDRVRVLSISESWAHVVVPGQPTRLDSRGYPGWVPVRQLAAGWLPAAAPSVFVTAATTWLRRATGERSWEISAGTRLERLQWDAGVLDRPTAGRTYGQGCEIRCRHQAALRFALSGRRVRAALRRPLLPLGGHVGLRLRLLWLHLDGVPTQRQDDPA